METDNADKRDVLDEEKSKSSYADSSVEYQETLTVGDSPSGSVVSEDAKAEVAQKTVAVQDIPAKDEENSKLRDASACTFVVVPRRTSCGRRFEDSHGTTSDEYDGDATGSSVIMINEGIDCSEVVISLCNSYQSFVDRIHLNRYMIPVYFILLTLPASAAVFGALGIRSCPMSPSTPVMLFMIGLAGILGFTFKIAESFLECVTGRRVTMFAFTLSSFCYVTVLLLHSAEMLIFIGAEPDDDMTSESYCDPLFYWFTYWVNWIGLVLILIFGLLYLPGLFRAEGQPIIPEQTPRRLPIRSRRT